MAELVNAGVGLTAASIDVEPPAPEGMGQDVAVEEHDGLLYALQKLSGGGGERAVAEEARGLGGV